MTFPILMQTLALGAGLLLAVSGPADAAKAAPAPDAPVYKLAIAPGVSLDDAAESMRLRANALNLKLVAELPLSRQVEAVTGKPQRVVSIFQFCDAVTAMELIDMSIDFAIYMPCRIALIEDARGRGWLVMTDINVDLVAKEKRLQKALTARIKTVRSNLIEIMQAGAKGDL